MLTAKELYLKKEKKVMNRVARLKKKAKQEELSGDRRCSHGVSPPRESPFETLFAGCYGLLNAFSRKRQ